MTRVHGDVTTPGFDRPPLAPLTGPFPSRAFVEQWASWRAGTGDLVVVEDDDTLAALWQGADGVVSFAGEADLTDYHSPLGASSKRLFSDLRAVFDRGTRLALDSLPVEAADDVESGLVSAGLDVTRVRHEITAVLDLPSSYEAYLAGLDKKQRHEVRRKRRRFAEAFGPARLERTPDGLDMFVGFHRAAPGEKGEFMTPAMAEFFERLLGIGFGIDVVLTETGHPVAAAIGVEDDDAYYLYNSAFDPTAAHASPGAVLVDLLIDRAITSGRRRFDFLKGDEVYKFRLGATDRPLFRLEAAL